MKLTALLDMHRARYLDHFNKSIRPIQLDLTEVLLVLDRPVPDELYRLYRADALRNDKGEEGLSLVEIELADPYPHAPYREQRGESIIELRSFHWNRCIIEVLTERFDRAALIAWGTHWMDIEDLREPDLDRQKGVIHYISAPSYPGGKLTLLVDFGTAPVKAVTELIQVLTIGSKSYRITLGATEPGF